MSRRATTQPKSTPSSVPQTAYARLRAWLRTARAYLDSPGILPWLLNILLAFLLIKFVVFPLLSLVFGSALPIVAVMSGSMEHEASDGTICGKTVPEGYDGSFDAFWTTCGEWYERRGITRDSFASFPLHRGFDKGDIMVILGPDRGTIEVGDTIVFESRERYPIIHRVVAVETTPTGAVYATKGDHNPDQIVAYLVVDGRGFASACHRDGEPVRCLDGVVVTRETPGAVAILDETAVPHDAVIGRAIVRIPWLGWIKIWFTDALNAILK